MKKQEISSAIAINVSGSDNLRKLVNKGFCNI